MDWKKQLAQVGDEIAPGWRDVSSPKKKRKSENKQPAPWACEMSQALVGDNSLAKDIERWPYFFAKIGKTLRNSASLEAELNGIRHISKPNSAGKQACILQFDEADVSSGQSMLVEIRKKKIIDARKINLAIFETTAQDTLEELHTSSSNVTVKEVVCFMELQDAIKNMGTKLEDAKRELKKKEGEFERLSAEIDAMLSSLKEKSESQANGLEALKAQIEQRKSELEALDAEIIAHANALGSGDNADLPEQAASALEFEAIEKQMSHAVDSHILQSALMALFTNQLIVLTGKPGTGKSTFAGDLATALGARFTRIEVQSNWSDSESLLGYYDPTNKRYSETPFLRALLEARDEVNEKLASGDSGSAHLHIICLDEMNLSRVEYYFATFLSLMQADAGKRTIRLLPPDIEQRLGEDEYAHLKRYRSFELPENVRFIGTINMDDTTYDLSPKVIDRSFFITFDNANDGEERTVEVESYQPLRNFKPQDDQFATKREPLATRMKNRRFEGYCNAMWSAYKQLTSGNATSGNEIAFSDLIVLSKVLPSLPLVAKDESEKVIDWPQDDYALSNAHIEKMREFAEWFGTFTFFCER